MKSEKVCLVVSTIKKFLTREVQIDGFTSFEATCGI